MRTSVSETDTSKVDDFRLRCFRSGRLKKPLQLAPGFVDTLNSLVAKGASPGSVAATVDDAGIRSIVSAAVRKAGAPESLLDTDAIHIGSNAKAMTSTMLATLDADAVFATELVITLGDVFPELGDEIHEDYDTVALWGT